MKRIITSFLICVMMVGILSACDMFIKTNDGKADLFWYMNLTNEDENGKDVKVTVDGYEVVAVALEDEYSPEYALKKDDDIFVNLETVKMNIDDRFHWDVSEKKLSFTDNELINTFDLDESERISTPHTACSRVHHFNEESYPVAIEKNGAVYINVRYLETKTNLDSKYIKSNGNTPSVLMLTYGFEPYKKAVLDSDIEIRTKGNYQNLIVQKGKEDSKVRVVEKGENWSKIRTDKGIIGYVPTKYLDDLSTEKPNRNDPSVDYKHNLIDEKITMVWHQVSNLTANSYFSEKIASVEGVNVVAPTWFGVANGNGALESFADADYVRKAHKNGMKVWGLVQDITNQKAAAKMLKSQASREKYIRNLLIEADNKGLDGINVDFELVTKETARYYRQFLRELYLDCNEQHFVLSVDNYMTEEDNYYDIKQQSRLADYIVVMSYDEHNNSSKEAGSVSSIGFTEKSIKSMVNHVGDSKRVINGCPFYTRLWESVPEGKGSGEGKLIEDAINGNYYLSSEVLGMDLAKKTYKKAGVKPVLDQESGQNYVTWEDGDITKQMWLEDELSMKKRMDLAKKYKLGGSAFWALGLESKSVWKIIND